MSNTTDVIDRRYRRDEAAREIIHKRLEAIRALSALRMAYTDEMDAIKDDGAEASDLIPFYGSIRKTLELLMVEMDKLTGLHDHLKFGAIPQTFERDDIRVFTTTQGDRVHITTDTLASILKDERDQAYSWLRQNNHGDIIVEYIFPGTLSAFAKSWMNDTGKDFPEEARLKVDFRTKAVFTAGKTSPNKKESSAQEA